jgi:Leucine-rich repeat (LRR) protein
LQLASLEILDLAKNKLRSLPDEIRSLTSLKVLAVPRNRIERLPTCLGEMSRLCVLKVEDNPLQFPPYELCVPDDRGETQEKEALKVTNRIKRFLLDNAGKTSRLEPADSDSEMRFVFFVHDMKPTNLV